MFTLTEELFKYFQSIFHVLLLWLNSLFSFNFLSHTIVFYLSVRTIHFIFFFHFSVSNAEWLINFISKTRIEDCFFLFYLVSVIELSSSTNHCVKSVRVRSYSGPSFPASKRNAGKYVLENLRIRTLFS